MTADEAADRSKTSLKVAIANATSSAIISAKSQLYPEISFQDWTRRLAALVRRTDRRRRRFSPSKVRPENGIGPAGRWMVAPLCPQAIQRAHCNSLLLDAPRPADDGDRARQRRVVLAPPAVQPKPRRRPCMSPSVVVARSVFIGGIRRRRAGRVQADTRSANRPAASRFWPPPQPFAPPFYPLHNSSTALLTLLALKALRAMGAAMSLSSVAEPGR